MKSKQAPLIKLPNHKKAMEAAIAELPKSDMFLLISIQDEGATVSVSRIRGNKASGGKLPLGMLLCMKEALKEEYEKITKTMLGPILEKMLTKTGAQTKKPASGKKPAKKNTASVK